MNASDTQAKDTRGYYRAKGRKGYVTKTMDPIDRALLVRHNRIVWRSPCIPLFYILYSSFLSHFLNSFFFFSFFPPSLPSFPSFFLLTRLFSSNIAHLPRPLSSPFFLIPYSYSPSLSPSNVAFIEAISCVRTYVRYFPSVAPFEVLEAVDSRPSFSIRRRFEPLHRCLYCASVWGAPASTKLPSGVSLRGTRVS